MIDYVVPMVFHSDPYWRKDLWRARGGENAEDVRYRSWNTEELLVRCVRKYMPFVRNIIILLARDSQRQPWMAGIDGLRVVTHAEFMPAECLPTFNSRAIEMFLHRIPGLSERFLYGNDDMFPLSPLAEENFFIGPVPCQHHRKKVLPNTPNGFQTACLNGLNFVGREFGVSYSTTLLRSGHSIAPILQESCLHLWQRSGAEIMKSITPFREKCNFNQYIYAWYQHFSGNYIDHVPRRKYLSVKNSITEVTEAIADPQAGVICINDNGYCSDIRTYARIVKASIEKKLET